MCYLIIIDNCICTAKQIAATLKESVGWNKTTTYTVLILVITIIRYALTLIGLEEKRNNLTPLVNNFSKNSIEERIVAIMKMKKFSAIGIIVALLVVVFVIIEFATSGATEARDSDNDSEYKVVQEKSKDKSFEYTMYEGYGMTYNSKTGNYYYDGKEVRFFYDAVNKAGFTNFYTGKVDIEAKYDKNGKLIELEYSSKEDYDRRTKKSKETNNSSDSTEQVATKQMLNSNVADSDIAVTQEYKE